MFFDVPIFCLMLFHLKALVMEVKLDKKRRLNACKRWDYDLLN